MTLDIEKVFFLVNYLFLVIVLEKCGFKGDCIKWIQIIIKNQEPCVIIGGATTNYFKLESGTRQGDPISLYILILNLEFALNDLNIFEKTFLDTAYTDDTTFFLRNGKICNRVNENL